MELAIIDKVGLMKEAYRIEDIAPTARAEDISIEDFCKLSAVF